MNPLGRHWKRIESEYLERLNKVRYGLDGGWQPPGLLLKGGTDAERSAAMGRLQALAEEDGFFCSYVRLGPELPLRDTAGICRAALEAVRPAGAAGPDADLLAEVRELAAGVRRQGKDGWVVLFDPVDRFAGTERERAESYRELTRWMGALPGNEYPGLFCLLAVTGEFEKAVGDPEREMEAIRAGVAEADLLGAAETGIGTLRHEAIALELLVLEL